MSRAMNLSPGFGPMGALPANTSVPAVTGTPTVGQTLSASEGLWTAYPPAVFSYQWKWGDTDAAIVGATSPTYLLAAPDETHTIKCTVTATNQFGAVAAVSAATEAVAA